MTISSRTFKFLLIVLGCLALSWSPDPLFAQRGGGHGGGFHDGGGGGFRGGGGGFRGGGGYSAGARPRIQWREHEDSAARRGFSGGAYSWWVLFRIGTPAERGLSEVRPIVAARTAVDHVDMREAHMVEIAARRPPVAVASQAAQRDLRMLRGPSLTGSGIRLAAQRAGIRHSPVLAEREMDKRRECATPQLRLRMAAGIPLVPVAAHVAVH